MKGSGLKVKKMAKVLILGLTETNMKGSGLKIKKMAKVLILGLMETNTKGSGRIIIGMVLGFKSQKTGTFIKVNG